MIKTSAFLTLKSFQLSSNLALVIPSVFFFNPSLFLLCLPHIVITYIVLIQNLDINDPKGASRSSPSITLVHAEHKSFLPFPPSLCLLGKKNQQLNKSFLFCGNSSGALVAEIFVVFSDQEQIVSQCVCLLSPSRCPFANVLAFTMQHLGNVCFTWLPPATLWTDACSYGNRQMLRSLTFKGRIL